MLDLHSQKVLSLKQIEILVLDEADRMLDMGFQRDINKIMNLLPKRRQNLLFSATFSKEIKALAQGILHQPVLVEATPANSKVDAINQRVYIVDQARTTALKIMLINEGNWSHQLVFTRKIQGPNT